MHWLKPGTDHSPADIMEQHAPLLYLHPREAYGPVHPDVWLEGAKLQWYEGSRAELADFTPTLAPQRDLIPAP